MATLDKSNVVNGNIVEASDITALYNALTAGGGYDVSISGSITGSASTAISSSYAVTSSFSLASEESVLAEISVSSPYATISETATSANSIRLNLSGVTKSAIPISGLSTEGVVDIASLIAPLSPPTTLGVDLIITANDASGDSKAIGVSYSSPNLTFIGADGGAVIYQGYVIQP